MLAHEILYLSEFDVKELDIKTKEIMNIVERTFSEHNKGRVNMPLKSSLHTDQNKFYHSMPAMIESADSVGIKWVSYYPGNRHSKNTLDASCIIVLNDIDTGIPICIMEGLYITYLRTAAAAAVAVKHFANEESETLGIVGAGELSRWTLHAILATTLNIKKIRVLSRTQRSRDLFCEEMSNNYKYIKFIKEDNEKSLVSNSDIIISTTPQPLTPFLEFQWVKKGSLVLPLDMIAAWKPDWLEKADNIITDDNQFMSELMGKKYGIDLKSQEIFEVGEVLGKENFRCTNEQRNIAFMNGVGSTDVMLGKFIYDRAIQEGIGQFLPYSKRSMPTQL